MCPNSLNGVCYEKICKLGYHVQGTNTKEAREKNRKVINENQNTNPPQDSHQSYAPPQASHQQAPGHQPTPTAAPPTPQIGECMYQDTVHPVS